MNGIATRQHPESDRLAAFLDGSLHGDELNAIAEHLRGCRECRQILAEAARFEREEAEAVAPAQPRRVWWIGAVAAAAAALVVTVGIVPLQRHYREQAAATREEALLALQHGQTRLTPGRLEGYPYLAYDPPRGTQAESWDAGALASRCQKELTRSRSAASLRCAAIATMALGHPDEAARLLTEAVASPTADPHQAARLLSDLAAAELAANRPGDAQHHAELALQKEPAFAAAAFNRAAALQAKAIQSQEARDAARRAWDDYLRLDPNSRWSEEARRNVTELQGAG